MDKTAIRYPAFAGQFYPLKAEDLKKEITSYVLPGGAPQEVIACLVPHAGYQYSGSIAIATIQQAVLKDTIILLGPKHTEVGAPLSIMTEGSWRTPLGSVKINSALASKILAGSNFLENDSQAHAQEHSLEVQLPIIQYFKPDAMIVPIALISEQLSTLQQIGRQIAKVVSGLANPASCMLMASSDMTHFETQQQAVQKDQKAIRAILALDEEALFETVERFSISMCGCAPCIAMIAASLALGASQAKLVGYQTSGDVTGDTNSVVGYAGIHIW